MLVRVGIFYLYFCGFGCCHPLPQRGQRLPAVPTRALSIHESFFQDTQKQHHCLELGVGLASCFMGFPETALRIVLGRQTTRSRTGSQILLTTSSLSSLGSARSFPALSSAPKASTAIDEHPEGFNSPCNDWLMISKILFYSACCLRRCPMFLSYQ